MSSKWFVRFLVQEKPLKISNLKYVLTIFSHFNVTVVSSSYEIDKKLWKYPFLIPINSQIHNVLDSQASFINQ